MKLISTHINTADLITLTFAMKINIMNIILLILFLFIDRIWSFCELDVSKDFGSLAPLIMNIRSKNFIYPDHIAHPEDKKKIFFNTYDTVIAYCPGSTMTISGVSTNRAGVILSCISDSLFRGPEGTNTFKDIRCSDVPESTTRKTGSCTNGDLIEIGFKSMPTSFTRTVQICYNKNAAVTYWAHSEIPMAISYKERAPYLMFPFNQAEISNDINVHYAYTKIEQHRMMLEIMKGNENLVNKYFDISGTRNFARGHLVSRSDQFYLSQQNSTHYYINSVPMWQCINGGNWRLVESIVQKCAKDIGDLSVYTGGLYKLELPTSVTESQEIFLAKNTVTGSPALFVPKLLFKLVFHPIKKKAIVFITINNPFLSSNSIPQHYIICPIYKKCHKLHPDFFRAQEGYTYCCLYDDFMKDSFSRSIGLPVLPVVYPLNV